MRVVIILIVGSHHGKDSILFFTILYRSINIMYILNYKNLLCYSGDDLWIMHLVKRPLCPRPSTCKGCVMYIRPVVAAVENHLLFI